MVERRSLPQDIQVNRVSDIYVSRQRNVFDREGMDQEKQRIRKALEEREQRLFNRPSSLNKEILGLRNTTIERQRKIQELVQLVRSTKSASHAEMTAYFALLTGAGLLENNENYKTQQILRKSKASDDVIDYFNLLQFISPTGANMKIGKISLADIGNQTKNNNPTISSILSYSMESLLMNNRTKPQDYVADNNTPLATEYPHFTAFKLHEVSSNLVNLFNFLGEESFPQLTLFAQRYPEYVKNARDLLKQYKDFHNRFYLRLFNPDPQSSEFQEVKEMVERYLDYDEGVKFMGIHFFSNGINSLPLLYREAKKLEMHPQFGKFYKKLTNATVEFAEMIQPLTGLRLFDDMETIFSPQESQRKQSTDMDTIRKLHGDIFSQSSKRDYNLDKDLIDWGDIVVPQDCKIEFDSKNPTSFIIELSYVSEEEDLQVELNFDTKKKEFSWNFLESPDDERMVQFVDALHNVTASILKNVYAQAKAIREAKRQANENPTVVSTSKVRQEKERPIPEVEESPKKRRRPSNEDISLEDLFSDTTSIESRAKRKIVLPDTVIIPKEAEERIKNKIDEFNRSGAGALTQLPYDRQGRILFKLRVGGLRILLRMQGNTFTVVEIGDRRDIYKKLPKKNI